MQNTGTSPSTANSSATTRSARAASCSTLSPRQPRSPDRPSGTCSRIWGVVRPSYSPSSSSARSSRSSAGNHRPRRLRARDQRARHDQRELAPAERLATARACQFPVLGRRDVRERPVCRPVRLHSVSPVADDDHFHSRVPRATMQIAVAQGASRQRSARARSRGDARARLSHGRPAGRRLPRAVPPIRRASPAEMRARLRGPAPAARALRRVLDGLDRDVLPFASRDGHPAVLRLRPVRRHVPGALGDFIASACNVYAGSWLEAAGPQTARARGARLVQGVGRLPGRAAGTLVSGGSAANLTALACAREALVGPMGDDLVIYVSDQAHSSIARAARLLGFRPDQVRVLPVDEVLPARPRARSRRRSTPTQAAACAVARRGRARERRTPARSTRWTSSPSSAASAASGCTSTRPTAASPRSPSAARRCPGSSWPTRSRSTRTSGSTSRSSAAACSSATARRCATRSRSLPDYLRDARRPTARSTSPTWACS